MDRASGSRSAPDPTYRRGMSSARRRIGALIVCALTALAMTGCASGADAQTAFLVPHPSARSTATPAAAASPSPTAPPIVVAIGDSIMAGYGLDTGQDWPTMMAAQSGAGVTNLACSGAGFIAVGSCGTDFAGLIDQAAQAEPTIVIVQGSDNDGDETDKAIDSATTDTVTAIHEAMPDALIVGLSTLWDPPRTEPHEITASSTAVQDAVEAVGGIYIDIGQPLQDGTGLLQSDDEHPTLAGQKVLLQTISTALARAGVTL